MQAYEKRILNALLDSYENSRLSRGENKVNIRVSFAFTKKTMPEYFDESSLAYEDIHSILKNLEQRGYVEVLWKKHIVQKVLLRDENVIEVYRYVKRVPKSEMEEETGKLLNEMRQECRTQVVTALIDYLTERIQEGKSVREFIDLADTGKTRQIIRSVAAVEGNREDCYIREFSLRHFRDSKTFENLLSTVGKIMRRFEPRFADMDIYAILAEYGIYHTPNYVYLKGMGKFLLGENGDSRINLRGMRQGIGLSGEDIGRLRLADGTGIRRVITIENLTTYFRWEEPDSILIYLGGYHNSVRRGLLQMLYSRIPKTEWFHFGDMDVDGFEIFEDLRRKTGIPFRTYHMGVEELKKYKDYAKPLTDSDRKRLERLMRKAEADSYMPALSYMQKHGIKLEQECISVL